VAGGTKLPTSQGLPAAAETLGGTRQAQHAASGSGPGGVNYNPRRAARFNGNQDIYFIN